MQSSKCIHARFCFILFLCICSVSCLLYENNVSCIFVHVASRRYDSGSRNKDTQACKMDDIGWALFPFPFNTAAFRVFRLFFFANISVCLIPHSNVWLLCGLSTEQKRLRNPASSVSYYSYTIVHNKCVCLYSCTKLRAADNPGLEPDYDSRITL